MNRLGLAKRRWAAWVVVLALAGGCAPREGDLVYAEAPDPLGAGGVHPLTLDLARPSGDGPHPAIVFVHGGGWNFGDLADEGYRDKIREAASRGYVAMTINYRLTNLDALGGGPRFPWPAQLEDVRCAVRWLRAHAEEYQVDVERIGIAGHSAGGHLSMMTALASGEARFDGDFCPHAASSEVAAVVSYAGPGDLAALYPVTEGWAQIVLTRLLDLPLGTAPEAAPAVYADASPVSYLSPDRVAPPILILQGLADTVVPPSVSEGFFQAAQAHARGTVSLTEIEGAPHDLYDNPGGDDADQKMWAWFAQYLQKP